MNEADLAWRIEEACFNACPSPREIVLHGRWMVRAAGGATRRINSVNPLRADTYDPCPVMDAARQIYRDRGQPLLFRAPTIAQGLDTRLERAGFVASDPVSALVAPLDAGAPDTSVDLAPAAGEAWLAAKFRLTPKIGARPDIYRSMLEATLAPTAFAALSRDGDIACVAYGVVHDHILVLESVVTDPAHRGRGCARRVVAALMAWARSAGARIAALQVEADNHAALALYRSLGFADECYRYRYFREP